MLLALLFWRSNRGAVLRLLSFALLLLALANPHLKQEDREPLNDVLAVVVDDSQSQAIAGRTGRTDELRKALEDKLKSFPNLDVRWVHSASTSADSERDGTMLFTDLGQAPVRRAARPAGGRDHDYRRRGARRARFRRSARLRRAGACALDRQAGRVRPQTRGG